MDEKDHFVKDSTAFIQEIEGHLEKVLSKRKDEIQKDLDEKIKHHKGEAEKKIGLLEKEFDKGREILNEYRSIMSEFEDERNSLQNEIKEHFNRAVQYQTDIEKMAALTLEELRKMSELSRKLETLHQIAEEKVGHLKRDLEDRFGVVAKVPEPAEEDVVSIDLEQELVKLKKIKELLGSEVEKFTGMEDLEEKEKEISLPVEEEGEAPAYVPEINEVMESSLSQEEVSETPPVEEKRLGNDNFREVYEPLEEFRKSEPHGNNGGISYFQNEETSILDGENLISIMNETLEEAKKLYVKLSQTESPKDQFFVKQEILNLQEVLRKTFLKSVKMCEKEGFQLPQFTSEILNLQVIKDLLERLSIENWSDQSDFSSFNSSAEALKEAFYVKITPPLHYLQSLMKELGIRQE